MKYSHRNVFPLYPRLDCRPDGIPKLCPVIIIVCGHSSIDFLLYCVEHMFVNIIKQDADFVKSPTGYTHKEDIDTNLDNTICINVNALPRSTETF